MWMENEHFFLKRKSSSESHVTSCNVPQRFIFNSCESSFWMLHHFASSLPLCGLIFITFSMALSHHIGSYDGSLHKTICILLPNNTMNLNLLKFLKQNDDDEKISNDVIDFSLHFCQFFWRSTRNRYLSMIVIYFIDRKWQCMWYVVCIIIPLITDHHWILHIANSWQSSFLINFSFCLICNPKCVQFHS